MKRPSRSTATSPSPRLSTIVCSSSALCWFVAGDFRISTFPLALGGFRSPAARAAGVPFSAAMGVRGITVSLTLGLTVMLKLSHFVRTTRRKNNRRRSSPWNGRGRLFGAPWNAGGAPTGLVASPIIVPYTFAFAPSCRVVGRKMNSQFGSTLHANLKPNAGYGPDLPRVPHRGCRRLD